MAETQDQRNQTAIERLLTLRKFPGLDEADLGELAIIAENVLERHFPAGALVASASRRPRREPGGPVENTGRALHLVVEGRLVTGTGMSWGPHEVCGALEAMAGRRAREDVFAEVPTHTLSLTALEFSEILEDNFGLLTSVRRSLAQQLLAVSTVRPEEEEGKVLLPEVTSDAPLGMVERLMVLRRRMPFGKGRIDAMAALAQAGDEVRLPANSDLAVEGAMPTAVIILLEGSARTQFAGGSSVLGPGKSIGALEALGRVPYQQTVTALTQVRALRFPTAALLDVLEDHTDLALSMVAALATALVDRAPDAPVLTPMERPPQVN